ncbi:FecR family protein [Sphingobacterium tabacisoli]|uniref:FecR family protein n=1 Tax=Sphingobacterium tabacisoli TaxID=2044855 RepID=A0ABW5L177_9SPHI|nr:FecR family protein [Sphingobacterium tabacisoli]
MARYPQHIAKILSAVHFREWTPQENAFIREWLAKDERNQELLDAVLRKEDLSKDLSLLRTFDTAQAWQKHKSLINMPSSVDISNSIYRWKPFLYMAASLVVVLGLVFLGLRKGKTVQEQPIAAIQPGANQATLKLSDGTVVPLSAGEEGLLMDNGLMYEDGGEVEGVKKTDFSSFEMSTPRGGQYRMTLPDGSKVWLNADTKLAYQEDEDERHIDMEGEAYFEVASQLKKTKGKEGEAKPFRVKAGKQEIAVLGTHFNVKSYKGEKKNYTTLFEGSVRISAGEEKLVLVPGEQGIVEGTSIKKSVVDPSAVLAWKEGNFVFNSERLDEILQQVGRWYDVDFIIEKAHLKSEKFEVMVPRFSQLKELLELLQKTGKIKFRYEDRTIYVSEK